jgi:hypothetical protein
MFIYIIMSNNWVDFQSGCGTCKASTDYVQYYGSGGKKKLKKQGGGMGQYEDVMGSQVMIPVGNSMDSANDMYPTEMMGDVTGAQMMDKNLGVAWATTGGANPKNKKKNNRRGKAEHMKRMIKKKNHTMQKKKKPHNAEKKKKPHNADKKKKPHNADKKKKPHNADKKMKGVMEHKRRNMGKITGKKGKNVMTHKRRNIRKTTGKNSQMGGVESMGATGMPARFYDANADSMNYGNHSGMGVQTAYGRSEPLGAGVGNLAPFNVSNASAPLSMQQTGGSEVYDPQAVEINYNKLAGTPAGSMDQEQVGGKKKRRKKKMKGGVDTETFTDNPAKSAVAGLQSSVDSMVNKFAKLNNSMATFDESITGMLSGGAKRKPKRKCPKDAASKHKYGKRMKGMDGNMWEVVKGTTGSKRWSKVTPTKKKKPVKKMTKKKLVVLKKKKLGTKKKKPVKKTTKKKKPVKKTTKKKVTKKVASKKKRR